MTTEQTDNDKGARTNGGHSFFKVFAALVLAMIALVGILIAGMAYSDTAQSLSSEPVYEATPGKVNPALEGKLVKMRVTEIEADGGTLTDETFGLSKENAIALHRCFIHREKPKRRIQVNYNELHGIRESWILAPQVKAGGYSLRARESFWEDFGEELINTEALTLPTVWENSVVSRTPHDIILRTNDTSNLAVDRIVFQYRWIPSPWRGVRHIVGRQHGNAVDLTGEGCGLIRGEQEYQQKTRIRSLAVIPMWEYCLWVLGLQCVITLCLIPLVQMLQNRGLLRATCAAMILGVLLCTLVAAAMLLLPYSEHDILTWAYTLLPCLLAIVLRYVTNKKRS